MERGKNYEELMIKWILGMRHGRSRNKGKDHCFWLSWLRGRAMSPITGVNKRESVLGAGRTRIAVWNIVHVRFPSVSPRWNSRWAPRPSTPSVLDTAWKFRGWDQVDTRVWAEIHYFVLILRGKKWQCLVTLHTCQANSNSPSWGQNWLW